MGLKAQNKTSKPRNENTLTLLCHEWKLAKTVQKDGKETKILPYHEFYITFTPDEKIKMVVDGKHEEMYWKYFEDSKYIDVNEHIIHSHNINFSFMKLLSVNDKVLIVKVPEQEGDGLNKMYFTKVR